MNMTFCFLKQVGFLRSVLLVTSLWLIAFGAAHAAGEVVLVTAVQGNVSVQGETGGQMKLEPFARLRPGDRLALTAGSQASLLFAAAGRMETWKGAGSVGIAEGEGKAATAGKPELQVRQIPVEVARQMNRTPSVTQEGRVGMLRMRSLPNPDAINRLEQEYARLRSNTAANDPTPEIFLLAGLYDLRQYTRLQTELKRIESAFPQDVSIAALSQVYARALNQP